MKKVVVILYLVVVMIGIVGLWKLLTQPLTLEYFFVMAVLSFMFGTLVFAMLAHWSFGQSSELEKKLEVAINASRLDRDQIQSLTLDLMLFQAITEGKEAICITDDSGESEYTFWSPASSEGVSTYERFENYGDRTVYFFTPGTEFCIKMEDNDDNQMANEKFKLLRGELLVVGYKTWITKNIPPGATRDDVCFVGKTGMAYVKYRSPLVSVMQPNPGN